MHTGNLLGQIPPLPSEVFADLVSTNNVRIERILPPRAADPTGEWFDQDEHEWCAGAGEAILVFITPIPGARTRPSGGRGLSTSRRTFSTGWSGTHPTETNRLALRLLLVSSRLKKAMLLLRRRGDRGEKAQSVDWALLVA